MLEESPTKPKKLSVSQTYKCSFTVSRERVLDILSFHRAIAAKAIPATPTSPATELFIETAPFEFEPDVGEAEPEEEAPEAVDDPPAVGVADASG